MTRADWIVCTLAVALLFVLPACQEVDDMKSDRNVDRVTITWVTVDDPTLLDQACSKVLREHNEYRGCASYGTDPHGQHQCIVWTPPIVSQSDDRGRELLGHEILHCFRGAWH